MAVPGRGASACVGCPPRRRSTGPETLRSDQPTSSPSPASGSAGPGLCSAGTPPAHHPAPPAPSPRPPSPASRRRRVRRRTIPAHRADGERRPTRGALRRRRHPIPRRQVHQLRAELAAEHLTTPGLATHAQRVTYAHHVHAVTYRAAGLLLQPRGWTRPATPQQPNQPPHRRSFRSIAAPSSPTIEYDVRTSTDPDSCIRDGKCPISSATFLRILVTARVSPAATARKISS